MEANVLLTLLPFLTGVFSLRPKTIYTRAGEMVVLRCPQKTYPNTNILWTNQTRQGMNLTSILSTQSADLSQMDVLLHGHNLVILRASLSHQGNYSCSVRNASRRFWFSLIVYEPQSREYEERNRYSTTCYTQESCTLYCPAANIPAHDTPDITGRGITWHKEGETVSTPNDFPSAVERDGGIYKCIRSFLYDGQIYNMSFSVMLEVQKSKYGKSEIISPQQNDVFHIDLGSTLVIDCKAVAYSDYDVVFWLSEGSFVDTDESLPVFYNYSSTKYIDEVNMTASLVFKHVSEEDLLKKYTCKLESDHQQSSFITVSLAERRTPAHLVSVFPVLCSLAVIAVVLFILLLLACHVKRSKYSSICPVTANEIYAYAGDLVMLHCRESKHNGTVMLWKMETDQKMHLYSNMSASEQQKLGLVFYRRSLVILRASTNHQGNYSCGPLRNSSRRIWFRLTICPKQSTECTIPRYSRVCYAKTACDLSCPEGSIPNAGIPALGMTSMEHVWHKENGEASVNYFPSVGLEKSGVYICMRSFSYSGEIYNTSSSVELDVQTGEPQPKLGIYLPKNGQIFEVELGTRKVIACKALVDSCQNIPFWTSDGEFVDDSDVSPGNLSKTFTCAFSSDKFISIVNITLVETAQPSHVMLTVCSVCVVVSMVVIVVVYVKFKIDVTLFLRDKVGFKDCRSSTSEWVFEGRHEKSYDAFLMCYKSVTDGGLNEEDRKCLASICPMTTKEIYVRAGDLVMLQCGECKYDGTVVLWKLETGQKTQLYSNMSASEQQRLGLVLYQDSLVILSASLNHQGNYWCGPLRNTRCQMEFRLTVYSESSREAEFGNRYSQTCYKNQTCELNCPEENLPSSTAWKLLEITWHKENGQISEDYFPNVDVEKSGVYFCTRSFLYSGQTYNTSFTVVLDVQTGKPQTNLGIYSPMNGEVFEVELGKTAAITCTALIDSSDGSLFWLRNDEFVEKNDTLRYFYNDTFSKNTSLDDVIWLSATLVFREVLAEDLSTEFSCKLESAELTRFVSVTLDKTAGPSYVTLTACVACVVVVMAVIVATYVKFKIDVTLLLRGILGSSCQSNKSDEKSYDAFLMCYKSVTDGGLSEEDRKCLASTLEDEFGYSICLYDRDVLPGQAVADAVLDCIEQSRAVVLVPSFPDPEPGSAVLSAIHTSLVERKTRLIFINTEQAEASTSGSFPEALQLLSKAGNSVTWKGQPPSTSFWKQL
ncbi:hypothetical protein CCH79_00004956, partial [Gambusia affinis]